MRYLLLLSGLLLWVSPLVAQKIITKSLPWAAGQTVQLNLRFGEDIRVRYWDKSTVSVQITATINNGKLNDALRVETASDGQAVGVTTDFDQVMLKQGRAEDCPDNPSTRQTHHNGEAYSVCSTIYYEVSMPRNAPLRVETINANIDIRGATSPVLAKSISGFVDVSWPGSKGASVAMKTVTGEAYSDLSIQFTGKRPKNPLVGYLLEGTLLSGGPQVRLESISNNVFLRREK